MSNYFKDKVSKFLDRGINKAEQQDQQDQKLQKPEVVKDNDIIIEQDNDMAYFKDPVLIPRHLYENNMDKFSCKAMYSALFVLMKYCDSNGVVTNQTTKDLAGYYEYKDCRNIRSGLGKLQEIDIITIDRTTRPFTYYINDYHFKKGGFVIPEQYMQDHIKETKLKLLRLEWYYMVRNLHSPRNTTKFNLRLDNLKTIINADSYKEVTNLAKDIKDKFFDTVETVVNGVRKGHNKLKTTVDSIALGVLKTSEQAIQSVKSHFRFDDVKYIFKELKIKPTLAQFKEAFNLIDRFPEVCLVAVKDNCTAERFKSDTGSVGYLDWLLQFARDGGIQPQQ